MTDIQLYKEIEALPENLKKQVMDFIAFLKDRAKKAGGNKVNKPVPQFGRLKGKIEMSDDFDDPLEEFKEYM